MWDTDYSTTVAGGAVYENEVEYSDNAAPINLIGSSKFAAGDYLVELSATEPKQDSGWFPVVV